MKREVDLVILSDVHLGTYGCRAQELLHYLYSIKPAKLVLNGDIMDIWQFKKSYFPDHHLKVIKYLFDMAYQGCEIIYITGNHDEMLRKFSNIHFGNIQLVDKLVLHLGDKRAWIFHGDVFDASIQHSKWLAKLGGWGYDRLIGLNNLINWVLVRMGKEKYSLSKRIKNSVKKAVKFISDFEQTASELAIESEYDYVICGHIHQPQIRTVVTKKGSCVYMNSGDWIENLSALEYHNGEWDMFAYEEKKDTLGKYPMHDILLNYSLENILERVRVQSF
ncbi:UDP-2,3-diacylglucosamine diphosphatase [Sphingobacterium alkalisoli]|uniref:UDP-2,3-diacylglucosamine diphosphatase n=1 Tax=Sphingobacterium alkalisoli TaxID=1874115 RepID=A0A4U0HC29_9SPHI|nr:UDP-2,3-diacylglucosamine diphosphatase [Sphingobacterium alkalisoli]TJY68172.1 UDP-2,3-diacylglucosamine diphosphatase [Sphingobacterium alkalisoli]GGH08530.1 UDP-2,3-diacylglucosamine hydrolase [Sphingobacterium alkalisoli]